MRLEAGQRIGDYEVLRPLGRGGLGAVYEARHTISHRREALKVLLPEQMGTPEMHERFRREIQVLAALNHPNIARLHSAFEHENNLVMAMELVEGQDLRSRSQTQLPLPVLLDYIRQVLDGLSYAHQRGVVHRDIKPANVMISSSGPVKVLDFGIALSQTSTDLTMAGALIGSPAHMSPEQIRAERATPQSDIYAVGVLLYELIAGQPPLRGATTYEILTAHLQQIPRPLQELRPDIPESISHAVARALEKDPVRRFASAEAFQAALSSDPPSSLSQTATMVPSSTMQRTGIDDLNRPTSSFTAPVQALVRHLASFIGPIAKVIVSRHMKQTTDLDQLYALAAKEIETEADRQRFLRTRPH